MDSTRDPLHVDADGLRALASDPVVRRGIAYFRENRVVELGWDHGRLWALVEGTRPNLPYQVEVRVEGDELAVDCDCPFELEPACKHAVAVLLAYGARQQVRPSVVASATDEALEERAKRGRAEVVVRHVGGDPWFGSWVAWSMGGRRGPGTERRVQIRSLAERANHCTCPDFGTNLLGTCKHVEAVLYRLREDDPERYRRVETAGPPLAVVTLAWDVENAPRIRLVCPRDMPKAVVPAGFDDDGLLRGELPESWHRLVREVEGRDDVLIGDDVVDHVRRSAEAMAQAARRVAIREEILRCGGRLPGVEARLYPYQVEGVAFLASSGRALLADDMGLGKTLQAIAAAAWMMRVGTVERVLVVTPASLKHQWEREIARFTGLGCTVVGGRPEARLAAWRQRSPFTVCNYEMLLRDQGLVQRELAPDVLVLDEAQRIKNWRTLTAAAVKALDTRYAFVLTGTPLENRLDDLYSLLQVVDPRVLGPLWRFQVDFHVTDDTGKVLGYRNLSELRRRLGQVTLRRDRTLVRDQLPDRLETQRDLPLDPRQRSLHDGALQTAAAITAKAQKERRPLTPSEEHRLMAALQEARMACDAAGLVDKDTVGSPKLDELSRLLEELCVEGGQKVVVFSEWERMTAMAEEVARALGLGTVRLHGGVASGTRGALVDRFRDDPAIQVFLSTDAGGVGLNLQVATALINLELPWNPAVLEQRIGRVHRLGQRMPVRIVKLVASESYEQSIAGIIAGKKHLFLNVVDPEAEADVVGLSRRTLELAVAALGEPSTEPERPDSEEPLQAAPTPAESPAAVPPDPDDGVLSEHLAAIQRALGARIDRVVATSGGLLIVVDAVEPQDEQWATSDPPVAIVDVRTWSSLARIGVTGSARPLYARPVVPVRSLARIRLQAAETLLQAEQGTAAVELAVRAMLQALAERADLPTAPEPHRAGLWVFGELVPRGLVTADDAGRVGRLLALSTAPDVPLSLARSCVADAATIVGAWGSTWPVA